MKVVIFAGGLGTRLAEETDTRPKPMVEVGGKPMIWHIMKIYSHYGFNEFIICLGYKGYLIKEYFMNYFLHNSDITIDVAKNSMEVHGNHSENFKVTLVETGATTKTAGRLKKVQKYIGNEPFFSKLLEFHKAHGKLATVTAVSLEARFGGMELEESGKVAAFREKAKDESKWINAGFFVLNPEVFKYLDGEMEEMMWEDEPLEQMTTANELVAYKHFGFWKCMDALRDKLELEGLWQENKALWKKW